jgi:membrane protease YdiL (CAAX protease family)
MNSWREVIAEFTPAHWIAVSTMGLLAAASVVGWFLVGRRIRHGHDPLEYEPRTPISWTGVEAIAVIAVYMTCGYWSAELARTLFAHDLQAAAAPAIVSGGLPTTVVESLSPLSRLMQGKIVGDVAFLVIACAVFRFARKTPRDQIGLATRPTYDLRVGLASFALIVPPVILLMAVLVEYLGESEHLVLLGLKNSRDPRLWLWSIAAVIGTAPLIEEFLFRGVIQNWLDRAWSFAADPQFNAEGKLVPAAPWAVAFAHDGPVVATAGFFALVHLANGPADPIPLFFFALGLGYLFRQTNRIWAGWIVHLLLNAFSLAILPLGF